jgi:hypothetical protein
MTLNAPLASEAAVPLSTEGAGNPGPVATNTPEDVSFASNPSLPRSQYAIDAEIDYSAHRVTVSESLTYVNRSSEPLTEIVLLVEPNRIPGAFQLDEIRWEDGSTISGYQLDSSVLTIPLPQPLPPWSSAGLRLEFTLSPPAVGGTFGFSERQLNLGDWYAFAPLYRPGAGWLAHPPSDARAGEHLTYDIADYQVEVRLKDPPPGLSLAASSPAQATEDGFSYQVQAARNFPLSASPEYEVIRDETRSIPVTAYIFPEHRSAGEAALAASVAALDLFREIYGDIPRTALTIVEGEFADGMEYDGLYFLSWSYFDTYSGGPHNFLTTLSAHETAHMWWAGLVANDQALQPWLDEALCTLSEKIFYERYYPEAVDWWWEFRVSLYEPEGWVDSTIYDHDSFRPYVNAVYLQGVSFLQEARGLLGEEAFLGALKAYLQGNSYGDGTTEELLALLDQRAPGQLDALIDEYFRSGGP